MNGLTNAQIVYLYYKLGLLVTQTDMWIKHKASYKMKKLKVSDTKTVMAVKYDPLDDKQIEELKTNPEYIFNKSCYETLAPIATFILESHEDHLSTRLIFENMPEYKFYQHLKRIKPGEKIGEGLDGIENLGEFRY